jgi:hypothetical protein
LDKTDVAEKHEATAASSFLPWPLRFCVRDGVPSEWLAAMGFGRTQWFQDGGNCDSILSRMQWFGLIAFALF